MPKVSEEYIVNKKQAIVDAAYRVCLRKPVEMVTMIDVIEEAGLSRGGIYRFYNDLDEVLCDMVTDMRGKYPVAKRFAELAQTASDHTWQEMVYLTMEILADVMEEHLMDIQKINFDLTVLTINEPDRAEHILGGLKGQGNMEYLSHVALPLVAETARAQGCVPKEDPEAVFGFIGAAYAGIEKSCILSACYGHKDAYHAEPRPLLRTLATTIICLLGGTAE